MRFFERALELSASTSGAYFPFTAYLGNARLLMATGRAEEGRRMLLEGVKDARRKSLKVREARIFTVLGEVAANDGKPDEAVNWLTAAADIAQRAGIEQDGK